MLMVFGELYHPKQAAAVATSWPVWDVGDSGVCV